MTRCDRLPPVPAGELLPMPEGLDRRERRALETLVRSMRARREVEVALAQAVAVGRGHGGLELVVRQRVCGGVSRAQQLAILRDAHEARMAAVLRCLGELEPVAARLGRRVSEGGAGQGLHRMCLEELGRLGALVERYGEDRLWLAGLLRRWWTLAPPERRA